VRSTLSSSTDCVGGQCRRRSEEVRVDDLSQQLVSLWTWLRMSPSTHVIKERNEDSQYRHSQDSATNTRSNPRERRITRPPKHKERNNQQRRRHQTKLDPDLGRGRIRCVSLRGLLVPRVKVDEVDNGGDNAAKEDAKEHETGDASGKAVADAEDDRIGFEHQVDAEGKGGQH
jgi:hypothetical protein